MSSVLFEKDGRIGRIILNRPEVMNAINDDLPGDLADAVMRADTDRDVHVMVLSGAGKAFCAGYDLAHYARRRLLKQSRSRDALGPDAGLSVHVGQHTGLHLPVSRDEACYLQSAWICSRWRFGYRPLCRSDDYGEHSADRLYAHARLGVPDHCDVGASAWSGKSQADEKAKRMMFTGDKITGVEAAEIGLVLKSVPDTQLDEAVETLASRMASVPINQLAMQKMVINAAVEAQINQTQRLATVFDGITRHSPEGLNFKARVEQVGWKQAVQDRDEGLFDWTMNWPMPQK